MPRSRLKSVSPNGPLAAQERVLCGAIIILVSTCISVSFCANALPTPPCAAEQFTERDAQRIASEFLKKLNSSFAPKTKVIKLGTLYNVSDHKFSVSVSGQNSVVRRFKDSEREKEWWYGNKPKTKLDRILTQAKAKERLQQWQAKLGLPKEAKFLRIELKGKAQGHENFMSTAQGRLYPHAHGYPLAKGSWNLALDAWDGQLVRYSASPVPTWKTTKPTVKVEAYQARATALKRVQAELKIAGNVDGFVQKEPFLCWDVTDYKDTTARLVYRYDWRAKNGGMLHVDAETGKITYFVIRPPKRGVGI